MQPGTSGNASCASINATRHNKRKREFKPYLFETGCKCALTSKRFWVETHRNLVEYDGEKAVSAAKLQDCQPFAITILKNRPCLKTLKLWGFSTRAKVTSCDTPKLDSPWRPSMVTTSASSSCTRSLKNSQSMLTPRLPIIMIGTWPFGLQNILVCTQNWPLCRDGQHVGKATEYRLPNLTNATSSRGKAYGLIYDAEYESYSQNHYYLSIRPACVHRHPLRTGEPGIIVAAITKYSVSRYFLWDDRFFEW